MQLPGKWMKRRYMDPVGKDMEVEWSQRTYTANTHTLLPQTSRCRVQRSAEVRVVLEGNTSKLLSTNQKDNFNNHTQHLTALLTCWLTVISSNVIMYTWLYMYTVQCKLWHIFLHINNILSHFLLPKVYIWMLLHTFWQETATACVAWSYQKRNWIVKMSCEIHVGRRDEEEHPWQKPGLQVGKKTNKKRQRRSLPATACGSMLNSLWSTIPWSRQVFNLFTTEAAAARRNRPYREMKWNKMDQNNPKEHSSGR